MNQDILKASKILEAWIRREGHNDTNRRAMESLTQLIDYQFAGGDDLWGFAGSPIPEVPSSSDLSPEANAEFEDFNEHLDAVLESGTLVLPTPPIQAVEAIRNVTRSQEQAGGGLHDLQDQNPQTWDLEGRQATDVGTDVDINRVSMREHAVEPANGTSAKCAQNHEHTLLTPQPQQQALLPVPVSNGLKRKFDGAHNDATPKKHQADDRRDSFFSQYNAATPQCVPQQSILQSLPEVYIHAVPTSLSPQPQLSVGGMAPQLHRSYPIINSNYSSPSLGSISRHSYTPYEPVKSVEVIDLTGPDPIQSKAMSNAGPGAPSKTTPKATKAVTKPKSNGGSPAKPVSPSLDNFTPVSAELQFIVRDVKKKSMAELQRAAALIRFHINEWQDERDKAEIRTKEAKNACKMGLAEEQKQLRRRLQEKCKGFEKKFGIVRAQIEERGEKVEGDSDTVQWGGLW
ncbi:hypothetical protein GRF29_185g691324 [Pseudopithomyces chartarum]|uniref:Uncharacterized protein n=1 Tax=Pseudopithomyces chartarum TaxID=1892770 RepID=A0AAN6LNZ0_9PLEO|nr:hypothetical protein GRF29_185g691324 [Pseudopithomyces chartarum]